MSKMHKQNTTAKNLSAMTRKQSACKVKANQDDACEFKANKDGAKNFASIEELYKKYPPMKNNQSNLSNSSLGSVKHDKLKAYHDRLLQTVDNVSTQKVTEEIQDVIQDITQIDSINRKYTWTQQDIDRLFKLNDICKQLPIPSNWYWAAENGSAQEIFNRKRMEYCVESELQSKVVHCEQCSSTGILVGLSQVTSNICVGCLEHNSNKSSANKEKFDEAWAKVRPVCKTFPKRVERGHESEELPTLTPGEKAVIAVVQPIVTITRNYLTNKRFRQESISLLHNSQHTWCKFLPRNDLQHRFMIVERRFKDSTSKYIIANAQKVKQWLRYLFKNHTEYMRMNTNDELHINNEALLALEKQTELAEVLYDEDSGNGRSGDNQKDGVDGVSEK